jgi:hypothetical protein
MVIPKTHAEKTSADKKVVGFEFQYWFFLWRVLQLKTGQTVGLEVADDVHTQLDDDCQILFQLKHTLKVKKDGTPENLTKYDEDLWKTLSNWSKVILDAVAGRDCKEKQLEFVRKTDFVLVSNKSQPVDEAVFEFLASAEDCRNQLLLLRDGTKSDVIKGYISDVLLLQETVLEQFIDKTSLQLEEVDLIERCKTEIREKFVPEEAVEQLLRDLDSKIRQDNFLTVKGGQKVSVSFADFNRKYRRFFQLARSASLEIRPEYVPLPERIEDQIFIRQLMDINDVSSDDLERMTALTIQKRIAENNLLRWQREGELTGIELENFDRESILWWTNTFREKHRDTNKHHFVRAQEVIDALRKIQLEIGDQSLGIQFSNGQFYKLSDEPKIGFIEDWMARYPSQVPA